MEKIQEELLKQDQPESAELQNEKTVKPNPENQAEAKAEKKPDEKMQSEKIDYKDKYLRALAELENFRKRSYKEKQETIHFSIENTVAEFLPVLDNFENALKFAASSSEEVKKWSSGFQMLLTQFKDVLYNHGIVAFHSEGNHFDPRHHEAMEIVETTQHPDGMILEEFAKGYKSENRTIRPAKVKVAKRPRLQTAEEPALNQKNQGENHE
ncbi:MAG: nucleotide exchange factor GrpE [Parachlamydiales bacterium]|jgi:molecular chaperone GrpE